MAAHFDPTTHGKILPLKIPMLTLRSACWPHKINLLRTALPERQRIISEHYLSKEDAGAASVYCNAINPLFSAIPPPKERICRVTA
jgi:hypothetical protein